MIKNNGFHNRHSPLPFNPASLFANGEQGWWYDPSNFTTLFQDSAGTTPVTAMEQSVGLQLDLSQGAPATAGPELVTNGTFPVDIADWTIGSSAAATRDTTIFTNGGIRVQGGGSELTAGARQVLSGLVVGKSYKVVTSAYAPSTNGLANGAVISTSSAPLIGGPNTQVSAEDVIQNISFTFVAAATSVTLYLFVLNRGVAWGTSSDYAYFDNITVKALPGNHRFQTASGNRPVVSARVNLFVGTATLATQSVTTRAATYTLTFTGAGSITLTGTAVGVYTAGTYSVTTTAGTLIATVLGAVTQADLRETNVGVGLPAYQAVVTSTNYDTVGFPVYIKPNGSNQSMQTNSIDFSTTDKMTLWQGVRKFNDASVGIITELSTVIDLNAGTFYLLAPNAPAQASYQWKSRGSVNPSGLTAATFAAPITNVITGIADIIGDSMIVRVNGSQVATSSADQGTGNFGNYPAYFYSRSGSGVFFGGNDYGSIARGAASTAAQIAAGEAWINQRTKAY